jgi:hypothetical protein
MRLAVTIKKYPRQQMTYLPMYKEKQKKNRVLNTLSWKIFISGNRQKISDAAKFGREDCIYP